MATNPYSYGSLGQRWTVGEPTSKSLLDVSRVKADANRWALEQLIVDPDDTANFVLTAPGLNIDSNTLYVDSVNNSVGFGLTNPNDYAFNGTPSWVASGGAGNASVIVVSGTTSTGYLAFADGTTGTDRYSGNIQYNHSTNTMSFRTNGDVEAMTINSAQDLAVDGDTLYIDASADRVGINTSSADASLHIEGSSVSDLVKVEDTGTDSNPNIQIANDARSYNLQVVGARSDNFEIWDRTAAATRLAITSAGNVGIGTDSPTRLLSLYSNSPTSVFQSFTNSSTGNTASDGAQIGIDSNNDLQIGQLESGKLIEFYNNGALAMAIDSSQRVGIGTSSPQNTLHVKSAADNAYLEVESSAVNSNPGIRLTNDVQGWQWQLRGADSDSLVAWDVTGGVGRFYLTTSGDVAIGRAPYTNYRFTVQSADSSSSTYAIQVQNSLGYGLIVARSDGQISTGNYTLSPYNNTTASAANVYVDSSGILYRSTSSAKYKTGVETIEDSYADAILNMRPVWYRSLSEGDNVNHGWWGFIAEEVAEIDPRLVQYRTTESVISEESGREETVTLDEPIPEGVSYDRFVPLLLNLIQRQQQSIATLETKVAALEAA